MALLKTIVCVLVFAIPAAFLILLDLRYMRLYGVGPTPKYWAIAAVLLAISTAFVLIP